MKIQTNEPPREFQAGFEVKRTIRDVAHIHLEPDEQVTFTTPAGGEYDVTRKDFGFYATPSLNSRLKRFGLKPALIKNRTGQFFVLLVEKGKEDLFERYLAEEQAGLVLWLDDEARMQKLAGI